MKKGEVKKFFRNIVIGIAAFFSWIWYTLWKDDSFKGWIFSIIFLFVFIRLIFFPALSLATGTSLPLAIVESCSMYHNGNLFSNPSDWWEAKQGEYSVYGINQEQFDTFSLQKGFNKGDILFITGANTDKLKKGDVIIFNANYRYPIIHRIVEITENENGEKIFSTRGDNNNGQLPEEKSISEDQIIGRAQFKLAPYLGWVKLVFFEGKKSQGERGFCS